MACRFSRMRQSKGMWMRLARRCYAPGSVSLGRHGVVELPWLMPLGLRAEKLFRHKPTTATRLEVWVYRFRRAAAAAAHLSYHPALAAESPGLRAALLFRLVAVGAARNGCSCSQHATCIAGQGSRDWSAARWKRVSGRAGLKLGVSYSFLTVSARRLMVHLGCISGAGAKEEKSGEVSKYFIAFTVFYSIFLCARFFLGDNFVPLVCSFRAFTPPGPACDHLPWLFLAAIRDPWHAQPLHVFVQLRMLSEDL